MAGFFGLFNFEKPGRGIEKDAPQKRGFFLFFEVLFRKFWSIAGLSVFYALFSIPALVVYYLLSVILQGMFMPLDNPSLTSWLSVYIAVFLISFLGTGPASMGQAYVLRNFARETHAWVWEDFWTKGKENFFKGILFFLLDILIVAVLTCAAFLYLTKGNLMPLPPVVTTACGFLAILLLLIYFMMHFFLYPLTVTMDMKAGALLKTALQLTMMNLPGCILIFIFSLAMFAMFFYLFLLNVGFILLFVAIGFSAVAFVYTFYSTCVIDKILAKSEN